VGASSSQNCFDILDAELAECCRESEEVMPAMRTSGAQLGSKSAAGNTLIVRNTFIDEAVCRPPSLDGFFQERVIRSCPASRQQSAQTERLHAAIFKAPEDGRSCSNDGAVEAAGSSVSEDPDSRSSSDLLTRLRSNGTDVLEKLQHASVVLQSSHGMMSAGGVSSGLDWDWFSFPSDVQQAWPFQWSSSPVERQGTEIALDQLLHPEGYYSELCSNTSPTAPWAPPAPMQYDMPIQPPPEPPQRPHQCCLPSIGSALHVTGECKPCWFVHKRGCTNGDQCTLCHLCPPGEWKRRRQQRRAEVERAALLAAQATGLDVDDADDNITSTSSPCDDGMDKALAR
jgi:hypothetical protein